MFSLVDDCSASIQLGYKQAFGPVLQKKYKPITEADIGHMNQKVLGVTHARWVEVLPLIMALGGLFIALAGMGGGVAIVCGTEHQLAALAPMLVGGGGGIIAAAIGLGTMQSSKPIYTWLGSPKYQKKLQDKVDVSSLQKTYESLKRENVPSMMDEIHTKGGHPQKSDEAAQELADMVVDYGLLGDKDLKTYQAVANALVQYAALQEQSQTAWRLQPEQVVQELINQQQSNLKALQAAYNTVYEGLNTAFTQALAVETQ